MRNKVIFLVIVLSITQLFYACSNEKELKLGSYVSASDSFISLKLQNDNEFILNGPAVISSVAVGTYSIRNGKLILTDPNEKEHVFLIENDKLVFKSGTWLESWVEQGTEFDLSDQ